MSNPNAIWSWAAILEDGAILGEIGDDGVARGWRHTIGDRGDQVVALVGVPPLDDAGQPTASPIVVTVDQGRGQRPIVFRKVRVGLGDGPGQSYRVPILYLGTQATIRGVNVQALIRVYPDGSVRLAGHDDDDDTDPAGRPTAWSCLAGLPAGLIATGA